MTGVLDSFPDGLHFGNILAGILLERRNARFSMYCFLGELPVWTKMFAVRSGSSPIGSFLRLHWV